MSSTTSSFIINTGNVLNLIDIKKKAGQNVTEELSESLKITLSEWQSKSTNGSISTASDQSGSNQSGSNQSGSNQTCSDTTLIARSTDDVEQKMAEEDRKDFKIGVKIFINRDSVQELKECLDSVLSVLKTESVDNVILSYTPPTSDAVQPPVVARPTGSSLVKMSTEVDAENDDSFKCEMMLAGIKVLWLCLEDYVKRGRISQLGVADAGGGCLRRLHAWATVRPSIAQINLASCCVVPPALHTFCKTNHVQLLTHADPPDFLETVTSKSFSELNMDCERLDWCARYQVHIKCRGVLALKGYVCKAAVRGMKTC